MASLTQSAPVRWTERGSEVTSPGESSSSDGIGVGDLLPRSDACRLVMGYGAVGIAWRGYAPHGVDQEVLWGGEIDAYGYLNLQTVRVVDTRPTEHVPRGEW